MKRNTFFLKYFIQFTYTDLVGSQKEGGDFLICFRKRGHPEKGGEGGGGGGFPQKRRGSNSGGNYAHAKLFSIGSVVTFEVQTN